MKTWTARSASEKAKARRLIASHRAKVIATIHETYISKRGRMINYEAWEIEENEVAS